jgi:ATP-dependent DNA ligase
MVLTKMAQGHTVQRKLNGDRAELVVLNGKATLFNRHGGQLSHPVSNAGQFLAYENTVLDGEVWQKKFYPFECLVFKGMSLMLEAPQSREACARQICTKLGLEWPFEVTLEWLKAEVNISHDASSRWEGVVIKAKGSEYRVLGSENQEWSKWKWC